MLTMKPYLVTFLATLATAACVHAQSVHESASATRVVDHTQMVFKVASAQSSQMLRDVRVSMIGRDGTEVELGQTDMFGSLTVAKTVLSDHQARVVLFSHERFFTGAILVEAPGL